MLKILKLTDGKAGHITITEGVIEAIRKNSSIEVFELSVKPRLKVFSRILKTFLRFGLLSNQIVLSDLFMQFFYKNYRRPADKIDIVVSTGGDTMFANVWLSRKLQADNIFCSALKGVSPEYFSLIISTLELNLKNSITLEIAPTKIGLVDTSGMLEHFCKGKQIDRDGKYFVLMIGGDGAGYRYGKNDYNNLMRYFMEAVINNNAKALITTSRRTGIENETWISELLTPYKEQIAHVVYYNQNPEKIVSVYLELAEAVYVTEESGSMITESLFYKKPLFTLFPSQVDEQVRYKLFLNDLKNKERIIRLNLNDDFSKIDIQSAHFSFIDKLPVDVLAEKLQPFLMTGLSKKKII